MYEALKKRKNTLLSGSERANGEKTRFWVTQKEQMEKKYASEWLRKDKWRKNMLLSDSEKTNGEKTSFWVTQKEQMEKKQASERLRKSKWRKNMLLSDSERAKNSGEVTMNSVFKAWGKNHEAGYHSLWSLVLIKRWYRLFIATISLFFNRQIHFLQVFRHNKGGKTYESIFFHDASVEEKSCCYCFTWPFRHR